MAGEPQSARHVKDQAPKGPVEAGVGALEWAVQRVVADLGRAKDADIQKVNEAWLKVWGKGGPDDTSFIRWLKDQNEYIGEVEAVNRRHERELQQLNALRQFREDLPAVLERMARLEREAEDRRKLDEAEKQARTETLRRSLEKDKDVREKEKSVAEFVREYEKKRADLDAEWGRVARQYEQLVGDAEKELGERLLAHHRETAEKTQQAYRQTVESLLAAFQEASTGLLARAEEELGRLRGILQSSEEEAKGKIRGYFAGLKKAEETQRMMKPQGGPSLEMPPGAGEEPLSNLR